MKNWLLLESSAGESSLTILIVDLELPIITCKSRKHDDVPTETIVRFDKICNRSVVVVSDKLYTFCAGSYNGTAES